MALDADRRIIATGSRLAVDEAVAMVAELAPAVVCIDSPARWAASGGSREAERSLARLGINAFRTPAADRAVPFHNWMRAGFAIYAALVPRYRRYRGGAVRGTAAECFPHASAALLAGELGRLKDKRSFRRRVLEAHGVATNSLSTIDQLDAALGALPGLIALHGGHTWVGDPDEGALLLPVRVLPVRLPRAVERSDAANAVSVMSADS